MSRATYPAVYYDEAAGSFKCDMRDKKTGRTWGMGTGETRQEAIYNARHDLPEEGKIRKAIGWVEHHPFVSGAAVGVYLASRHAKRHLYRPTFTDYAFSAVVVGTAVWAVSKIVKFVRHILQF